jgi:hypothetical protein
MKKLKIVIILILFLSSFNLIAQDSIKAPKFIDHLSLGFGGGLDYGGFGVNMLVYPHQNIGIFGGVGYALAGAGYNVGAKFRLISKKHRTDPYILAMYGYNTAIKVQDASDYNKLFYGPSFGMGIDYRTKRQRNGYWSFALLVPVRSPDVNQYIDDLKTYHNAEFKNELIPIAYSIGYRFILR